MTCKELIGFISDYLDGVLPVGTTGEFEKHLAICPSCVAYLDGFRKAVALGRESRGPNPQDAPPPEELLRAIRAARRRGQP